MDGLLQILQGYLTGFSSLAECAEWMAGVDWDDPDLTVEEKETLALFELLLTEAAEALREESEFWEAASEFVASKTQSVFAKQTFTDISITSSSASVASFPQLVVASEERESRSWNILLPMAP